MHSHLDFELGRAGTVEMRGKVGHNRLEARLAKARTSSSDGQEDAVPRKNLVAQTAALAAALFR